MSKTAFNVNPSGQRSEEDFGEILATWPHRLDLLESTPSTNSYLLEQSGTLEHGTLAATKIQSGGRGRFGRPWFSDSESIAFSVCLDAPREMQHLTLIPVLAAVAVLNTCSALGADVRVKWPNDITDTKGRKLCGILTELRTQGGTPRNVIVGIGLNVNQAQFPPEVAEIAQSLRILTANTTFSCPAVILSIAQELLSGYNELLNHNGGALVDRWKASCAMFGRPYRDRRHDQVFTPLDMADDGSLVVRNQDGTITTISSGEVIEVAHSY
ncbi:biotin--[acetyl-CoA-carboxylase] ligase [Desulfurispirillum indicum]|uniref:Biotin/acetyl-CoA-carboxylase ligase n=1 Tax=Desulfurispirillum indicum (strain ATCC BAA-1389 / DSM 22839 / S5) TaxID=653733 RepID=E6W5D0_DESIS|nr:biotin--[acetyl-CoA-carboxylase] ligase [Desulfurispirillum indicum]ADU64861.1 biotin/acetyl-CoA-carboxylase ligase [Desulfurispirillum indicum S5]UCZ56792.1 biotin--[acetyl-CoA-carboxylase] ligase [Desulfurispirillum indicum]